MKKIKLSKKITYRKSPKSRATIVIKKGEGKYLR